METISNSKVIRETEKAILVSVTCGDEFKEDCWFPKSQTEVLDDGRVAAKSWIIDAKSKELCAGRLSYVAWICTDEEVEQAA